jgi:tungstate transport system substrate-binding protein
MIEPISSAVARATLSAGIISLMAMLLAGCTAGSDRALVLATTTSVDDSGLLTHLLQSYSASSPSTKVRPLAVGSGEALELGRRGDADLLLVHSPMAEDEFMASGHGEMRASIMYNDFVVVGPPDDPADVAGAGTPARAFRAVAEAGLPFLSRGDESGTHRREREIWSDSGTPRAASWYLEAGQGMGPLLQMASERRAYTLTDRATFYAMQPRLDLDVLYEGDPLLRNVYSVILVRKSSAAPAATQLFRWLASEAGGEAIAAFRNGIGRQLFYPVPGTQAAWESASIPEEEWAEQGAPAMTGRRGLARGTDTADEHGLSEVRRRFLCRSVPPRLAEAPCD